MPEPPRPTPRRAVLAGLLGLGGCAPVVLPAGPAVTAPAVEDAAFVMADGARLPYRAWLPETGPRAVLLGLHGFGDTARNAFQAPAPLLTGLGLGLYGYDQRGFGGAPHPGLWPGAETLVADAAAVTRLVRARHPGVPVFLLGESMGVAVALVAATAAAPPEAAGYVLLAPAVRGRASLGRFASRVLDIAAQVVPKLGFRGAAPGFAPTDDDAAMERWSRDPLTLKEFRVDLVHGLVGLMDQAVAAVPCFTAPALVLYGAQDRIVPPRPVREVLHALPPGAPHRVAYYAQGHHLLLRDRNRGAVARDVAAWIEAPAAPLPSGADAAAAAWLAA